MKRKLPIGLIVASVIGFGLLYGTVYSFYKSVENGWLIEQWEADEFVRMKVDLSKTGENKGDLHQTCDCSHGQYLYIESEEEVEGGLYFLLKDIHATVIITDRDGKQVLMEAYDPDADGIGNIMLDVPIVFYCAPFARGDYTLTLNVHEGNAGLAGRELWLVGRYALCGLEGMSGVICLVAGIVLMIVTLPVGIGVIVGWGRLVAVND